MSLVRPEDAFKTTSQYAGIDCFLCCQPLSSRTSACGLCLRVCYCSKECQKNDWIPSHRAVCQAWTAAVTTFPLAQHPTLTSFPPICDDFKAVLDTLKSRLMDSVTKKLGPRAGKMSTGLVFRVSRCIHCLAIDSNRVRESGTTNFHRCAKCVVQWCANDNCRVADLWHAETGLCASRLEVARDDVLLYKTGPYPNGPAPFLPPRILRVETPLPLDWSSYLKSINLPKPIDLNHQHVFIQHFLSIPLTIVAALVKFDLLAKFSNAKEPQTLRIHVIGAEKDFEVDYGGAVLEEITHLLPGVRELVVVMVGPRLGTGELKELLAHRCTPCKRGRRTRRVELHPTTYHDFLNSNPTSSPPDLAVAFNSGICENPSSWKPTIDLLLLNQTPTVLTSLNLTEGFADENVILTMGGPKIEMVWSAEESPFPSGRRHFDLFTPGWFWSENMFWFGWKGKLG